MEKNGHIKTCNQNPVALVMSRCRPVGLTEEVANRGERLRTHAAGEDDSVDSGLTSEQKEFCMILSAKPVFVFTILTCRKPHF